MIYLSKLTACTPPRGNPNVNYGLSKICQCSFINCNRCTTWKRTLMVREVCVWGRWGAYPGYGQSLYFLLNFAVNLKSLSKVNLIKKNREKKKDFFQQKVSWGETGEKWVTGKPRKACLGKVKRPNKSPMGGLLTDRSWGRIHDYLWERTKRLLWQEESEWMKYM